MIRRMLWNSGEHPELVLEGLVPGEDRWSVRIEQISSTDRAACTENQPGSSIAATTSRRSIPCLRSIPIDPSLLSSEAFSPSISPVLREDQSGANSGLAPGDGGSPGLPAYQLWPKLWGTQDPAPDRAEVERMVEEDPLLHLAAEHSIPIDLDEQTFCISDRSHLDVIHNFVSASLSVGRLDTAIMILTKLLKGLDPVHDASMRYVRGAALHNLGVLYMWQAKYEYALDQFHLAVEERTATLPKDHPDVRVSLVWKGLAQFAQGRFEDALFCHELALEMTPSGDITRSKMLNNMGVVLYQMKHYMLALQKFTLSLEIQRGWLQGPVRRDSLVHEASLTLSNMGKLYLERGDYDLSYFVYEEALLLQTTIFRKDHDLVLESLMSLALTRARENLPEKALQILQGCLRSQTARYGKDSFQTMDALGYISYLHEYLKCPEDALKCLSVVKKWQKLNLPPGHPSLRKSRETLKRLEEAIGKNVSVWI
jgi:tetratricopeptide (TPR) repeat protein